MEQQDHSPESEQQCSELIRRRLERGVSRKPDGEWVNFRDQVNHYQAKLEKFYPDYKDPKKVILIPQLDAQEIIIANKLEGGKGFINEWFLRHLLDSQLSSRCKYLVVHGHKFHSKLVPGNDRLFFNALREGQVQVNETLKFFESEHDFILLHPKRGIVFIEIQGTDSLDGDKLIQVVQQKREQCRKARLCLKAYVKWALQQSDPEKAQHVDLNQLDQLFNSFASFVFFPSLNKSLLNSTSASEINVDILFMEDRQDPIQLLKTIENGFVDIQDQDLYQQVYDIALACCIASRHEIISNGLRLNADIRSRTREEHSAGMEQVFRNWAGSIFFDQDQLKAYEASYRVVFIDGRAGSGKTLVCFEKMVLLSQWMSQGKLPHAQILYLCASPQLANHVGQLLNERKCTTPPLDNICVMDLKSFLKMAHYSIHGGGYLTGKAASPNNIATQLIKMNEIKTNLRMNKQYGVKLPDCQLNLLSEAEDDGIREFRHIFVDEYQDFHEEIRSVLRKFYLDPLLMAEHGTTGSFWAFYDNKQKVMTDRSPVEPPENVKTISLRTIHRCPRCIAQQFMSYTDDGQFEIGHEYDGQPVQFRFPDQPDRIFPCLQNVITELKANHGISDDDIAVLTRSQASAQSTKQWRKTVHRRKAEKGHENEWIPVKFHSLAQLKGLERKVVIFYNPPFDEADTAISKRERSEIMYIAGSRATWMYILIPSSKEAAETLQQEMSTSPLASVSRERAREIIETNQKNKKNGPKTRQKLRKMAQNASTMIKTNNEEN